MRILAFVVALANPITFPQALLEKAVPFEERIEKRHDRYGFVASTHDKVVVRDAQDSERG